MLTWAVADAIIIAGCLLYIRYLERKHKMEKRLWLNRLDCWELAFNVVAKGVTDPVKVAKIDSIVAQSKINETLIKQGKKI